MTISAPPATFLLSMWISVVISVVAVLLIIAILIQARGTGLGASFGGDGAVFRTKRGIEKKLQGITIVLAVVFIGLSFANLFI